MCWLFVISIVLFFCVKTYIFNMMLSWHYGFNTVESEIFAENKFRATTKMRVSRGPKFAESRFRENKRLDHREYKNRYFYSKPTLDSRIDNAVAGCVNRRVRDRDIPQVTSMQNTKGARWLGAKNPIKIETGIAILWKQICRGSNCV